MNDNYHNNGQTDNFKNVFRIGFHEHYVRLAMNKITVPYENLQFYFVRVSAVSQVPIIHT